MLEKYIVKILDLLFIVFSKCIYCYIVIINKFVKTKTQKEKQKILALPFYPENWPGGHERIANWKPYFESNGISFDVSWAANDKEFMLLDSWGIFNRYYFFFLVLYRRAKLAHKLLNYDTIWIQRAFIPFYPYQDAYFELLLSKIHPKIIMDYYDADHVSNFNLTINSVRNANKVTVSTDFLKDFYLKFNSKTYLLNMTIDESNYKRKRIYYSKNIKLGWMGNRTNTIHLEKIEQELKAIEQEFPNVSLHVLCKDKAKLDLNRVTFYSWEDPGFNYNNWLSRIDIGLAPYFGDSDILKAKSSMKSLEFMACGIPLITSEYGIFNGMIDQRHFLLANNPIEWGIQLKKIIENDSLREKIGLSGHSFFKKNHTYERNLGSLTKILTN